MTVPRAGMWPAWVVLACALAMTAVAWRDSARVIEIQQEADFTVKSGEIRAALEARVTGYSQILRGAAAMVGVSERVSRAGWHAYVEGLRLERNYPAIQALAYAPLVGDDQLDNLVAATRASGVADFAVRPPGRRPSYVINLFSEPFVGSNAKALGYDMWQDADRRDTMERARTAGEPMITQKVVLKVDEDINPVPAFIMYMPVFAADGASVRGYVLSPFRMPILMRDLLGGAAGDLTLTIFDGAEARPDRLFHSSPGEGGGRFARDLALSVGGRMWTLRFASLPAFEEGGDQGRPRLILVSGLLASLLLFAIVWSLTTTRVRADRMAMHMTRSLRESEGRMRALFEQAAVGVAEMDTGSGRFLKVNQRFSDVLGIDPGALLNSTYHAITHPDDLQVSLDLMDRLGAGEIREYTVDKRYVRGDGAVAWVNLTVSALAPPGERPRRHLAVVHDIGERKRAEDDIRRLNAQLERRVRDLDASNAELEQFAYVASHDLREPLRMVSLYVDMLKKRYGEALGTEGREFIAFAKEGAVRMDNLVRDLLEVSRVGRGDVAMAPVDLGPVVERATRNLGVAIAETGATIERSADWPIVAGVEHDMVRLFQNLLGNALKYCHPERRPRVTLAVTRQGDDWLFAVSDNGIGFDPLFAEQIFRIFQRLHPRGAFEGTGIGLSICRKIVEHHGGRIWAEGRDGEGATFHFVLPAMETSL